MSRHRVPALMMWIAFVAAVLAVATVLQNLSCDDAQEDIIALRQVVGTDMECELLDEAQLAVNLGLPWQAHRILDALHQELEEE